LVTDREQELRAEAAKCLRLAQTAKDPNVRAELTTMAQRFLALTRRPAIDFEALVDLYNEQQVIAPANPVMQQQQQPPNGAAPSGAAGAEQTSFPRSPICPTCGKVMRLQGSSPAIRYPNLDQLRYACDCGGTAEKTVAHGD
jgi:lysyl-tRNA synthetase class I